MPPKKTFKQIAQAICRPKWAIQTLYHGLPKFANLLPYLPGGLDAQKVGEYKKMFNGIVTEETIKPIRDMWKGKLVLKGIASEEDAERAVKLGVDGIIVSNHGGR